MEAAAVLILFVFAGVGLAAQNGNSSVVNIGALYTFNSYIGKSLGPAIAAAVEDVNSDSTILKDKTINLILQDTNCSGFVGTVEDESTVSTTGKLVMVVWLFLLLVVTSSYTASLSSILTVQQLSTSITGLDSLVSSGLPIGYQVGSFAYGYMVDNLNIHPSRLVSLRSPEEYESALKRGPGNGGVAAIVDETPYVEMFLSKRTEYGMAGQPFTKSGWGFAFQKNSPLAVDISNAILKLTESGQLEKINNKWFCKSGKSSCPGEQGKNPEPNELHLNSFLVLYALTGIASLVAFSVFLFRAIRQYIDYKRRQLQRDPSSPATPAPSSSRLLFSRAIHNFLQFVDEKEEAIKRFFAQENESSRDVISR